MKKNPKLIYTPEKHIPIGEPVILSNGAHGIRIKWKREHGEVTEIISLDKLHELVIQSQKKISRDPLNGGTRYI